MISLLSIAEQTIEIADDSTNDWAEREGRRGTKVKVFDWENAKRSEIRISARQWLLTKLLPKVFGRHLPTTAEGDKPEDGFIRMWRSIDNGIVWLGLLAARLGSDTPPFATPDGPERVFEITESELVSLYRLLGSPKPEDASGPFFAKMFRAERMLERYGPLSTAMLGGEAEIAKPALEKPKTDEQRAA